MDIVKKTLFSSLGFILLIMFISYGITIIFGANATYLTSQNYTTSYGFEFVMYRWNYIEWSKNISDTSIWDNMILWLDTGHMERTWNIMIQAEKPSNAWEFALQALKYIAFFLVFFVNVIITALDFFLILPIQAVLNILYYALTLLGINMTNGSWWLANGLRWINQNFYIPIIIY